MSKRKVNVALTESQINHVMNIVYGPGYIGPYNRFNERLIRMMSVVMKQDNDDDGKIKESILDQLNKAYDLVETMLDEEAAAFLITKD
tara:strand:+ start:5637 stop:5900 length:264 start_codon:yes stop_codon:yes gene_type:complete